MAIARIKVWAAGEVLLASDLNGEFNNILNNPVDLWSPAGKAFGMGGFAIFMDSDADSSISASVNNRIDVALGGTTLFRYNTVTSAVNGIDATGSIAGSAPSFTPFGSDPNINLNLKPKGTGNIQANGSPVQAKGADIVSSGTVDLDAATGDYVVVTGTTTITAITLSVGRERRVRFSDALILTHGANLILLTGANQTTIAGDLCVFRGEGAGVVRQVSFTRASGQPLKQFASKDVQTFAVNGTWTKPAFGQFALIEGVGGGGGGGGATSGNSGSGGGGGGYGYLLIQLSSLSATEAVTVPVAASGGGSGTTNQGGTGGTVSFGSLLSVSGGVGGLANQAGGGAGGSFWGLGKNDIYIGGTGATGGTVTGGDAIYGGGGGGGGASGAAGTSRYAGNGGSSGARNGVAPGGGGAGSNDAIGQSGGNGAVGKITVTVW